MKIISVGNLSLGGTNKTPLTIKLGQYFQRAGLKIVILSLGYKGKLGYRNRIISNGLKHFYFPPLAADESYLIAENLKCPVITGKKREVSLELAQKNFSPDIVILDDAFQYRKIKKDLDLLLVDHTNPISTGFPFPFGMIREFPSSIEKADIILFTNYKNKSIPEKIKKHIKHPHYFVNILPLYLSDGKSTYPLSMLKNKRIYALCGIAKPNRFFKIISTFSPSMLCQKSFIDHKNYSAKDINKIAVEAARCKADCIVTTEKDFVKIKQHKINNLFYLKIDLIIDGEADFLKRIDEKLNYSFSCSKENSATLNQKPSLFIKSNSV
jgi:tetraacyldisaccharide 4'-kinase